MKSQPVWVGTRILTKANSHK